MYLRRLTMGLHRVLRRRSLLIKVLLSFPALWFLFVVLVSFQESRKAGAASSSAIDQPRSVAAAAAAAAAFVADAAVTSRAERDSVLRQSDGAVVVSGSTRRSESIRPPPSNAPAAAAAAAANGHGGSVDPRTKVDSDQNKAVLVAPRDDADRHGEMGKPVVLAKNLSSEVQKVVDKGWQDNAFNQYASDMVSLHRSLPDMRDDECKKPGKYLATSGLPDTSVIVCFHNEAWSVLLRTVHSVLDRSPADVLHEIILVDDASTMDHLKDQLEEYIKDYPKVKVVRSPQRVGLIRARLVGASRAQGKVLTYLDSHCECTPGWLEPLLDRIARNSTTVVCPVIDVIDDGTLEYLHRDASGTNVGGFDWNLQFNWHAVPESEKRRRAHPSDPVWSPTMAGGLFAIDRQYFEHLGTYDSGFDIWGGENLELSFKVWMCGGTLEIVPCSHVGHIFRKRSPYQWRTGVNVLKRNSIRLAEVWLDDYKQYYYQRIGNDLGDFGDVSSRKELRRRLNCRSFDWFLKNIYPELFVPGEAIASGEVRNLGQGSSMCLDSPARKQDLHKAVSMYPCHGQGGNQIRSVAMTSDGGDPTRSPVAGLCISGSYDDDEEAKNEAIIDVCVKDDDDQFWMLSKSGEIRRDEACLDFAGADVILYPCHGSKGNQHWYYDDTMHTLKHVNSKKCLEMAVDKVKLAMQPCDSNNDRQRWKFQRYGQTTAGSVIAAAEPRLE